MKYTTVLYYKVTLTKNHKSLIILAFMFTLGVIKDIHKHKCLRFSISELREGFGSH